MNHAKFENMILLAFPIALFAGCAGSGDMKPENSHNATVTQTQHEQVAYPNDVADISVAYVMEETTPIGVVAEQDVSTIASEESAAATSILPSSHIYYFETDKAELTEDDRQQLKQHADYLIANPQMTLIINGHADERGTDRYNTELSNRRAAEVYRVLLELGVTQAQLVTKAHGESQPFNDPRIWDENRRVELDYDGPVMMSEK